MNKYNATNEEIKLIKAAIKLHNMRGITWQSIAARPAKIDTFLRDTGMIIDINDEQLIRDTLFS